MKGVRKIIREGITRNFVISEIKKILSEEPSSTDAVKYHANPGDTNHSVVLNFIFDTMDEFVKTQSNLDTYDNGSHYSFIDFDIEQQGNFVNYFVDFNVLHLKSINNPFTKRFWGLDKNPYEERGVTGVFIVPVSIINDLNNKTINSQQAYEKLTQEAKFHFQYTNK